MTTSQATIQQNNTNWLNGAGVRNFAMSTKTVTAAGQTIDIELESVPGWAESIEVEVSLDLAITVAAGGTAPSLSEFTPENFFSACQLSLGGGPFFNVSPYFSRLREMVMKPGWDPSVPGPHSYGYASNVWSVPAVSAAAGSTTDNFWKFTIRVPLQVEFGSAFGHIPLGNADVTAKLRLVVQPQLWGSDHYLNPLVGGSGVTVAIGTAQTSYVQPNIWYKTTPPSATQALPTPTIQYILNVQEKVTPLTTAGSAVPIRFKDPFKYMRLWHIIINSSGVPDTTDVSQFELDLLPGYPQFQYTALNMQNYFARVRRLYRQDLPVGVLVFDLWAGSDPQNPNGTQVIDATKFQTMQTQVALAQGAPVGNPAKIITYAEALAPVGF